MYDGRNGGSKAANQKTPVATHPPSAAPTHLGRIAYLVWLMLSYPGVPILCCKRDVKAAFKLVWYSVADSGSECGLSRACAERQRNGPDGDRSLLSSSSSCSAGPRARASTAPTDG